MRIALQTFGCRLNHAESRDLDALLRAAGHLRVSCDNNPDLVLVRGCSVTARAERDSLKAIAHLRAQLPDARIIPLGCLPNAESLPLHLLVGDSRSGAPRPTANWSRAFLKVQDGCNGTCAFCIVPRFRGRAVSVSFAQVLDRARAFLAAGYRELVVTGCNLALYHEAGRNLADLLDALAHLEGPAPHRVRVGSLEPGLCGTDVLDVFAAHVNICRFLHLSLQSGAERVLARMNRPYTADDVAAFCARATQLLGPRLALGADLIAGFPGETEADHADTVAFLERFPFVNLHVFPYSERPGTPAATFPDAVSPALRRARAHALEALGAAARTAFARTFVGQTVEVCVEGTGHRGWTAEYLPCRLATPAPRRALVSVRVAAVQGDELRAGGKENPS